MISTTAPTKSSIADGAFTNVSGVPCLAGSLSPSITIDTLLPVVTIAS